MIGVLFLIELALVHTLSFWDLAGANAICLALVAAELMIREAFRL